MNTTHRPPASPAKLRILALHGFRGSGAALRRHARAFSAGVAAEAELEFVDAPARRDGVVGWWRALEETGPDGSKAVRYDGWATSRDFLIEHCQKQGPFDGLLGFSQGAALLGLLAALGAPKVSFAILISGFRSADPEHARFYDGGIQLPSAHIIGRADDIVLGPRSHALAASFQAPLIVEHEGGHVVPGSADVRDALLSFLRKMRAARVEGGASPFGE